MGTFFLFLIACFFILAGIAERFIVVEKKEWHILRIKET
jgi:hypothetical protein